MVIDHHRKVIGEQSVTTVNNKVFLRQTRLRLQMAAQAIVKTVHRRMLTQPQRGAVRRQM